MTLVPRGEKVGVKTWDPAHKKYKWIGTFATAALARAAERNATLRPGREMPTVAEWASVWLSDYARPAPATQSTYRYALRTVTAQLGERKLDDLGRVEARKLAKEWPRGVSRVARTMWADAIRDEVCDLNPWTNLRLETPKGRKDLDALSEQEVRGLAALAQDVHGDYGFEVAAIILTLGFVGLRPGELCALRTEDLRLNEMELAVRRSLDSTGRIKLPKNGKERIVTVPPAAADVLSRMPISLDGFLFHSPTGRRLSKGTLHYVWRPVVAAWRAQGGRDIDLYDLRHAAATHFVERGVMSSDVALQLGHSDGGRLVERLYGHPRDDPARDRLKMAFAERESELRRRKGFAG